MFSTIMSYVTMCVELDCLFGQTKLSEPKKKALFHKQTINNEALFTQVSSYRTVVGQKHAFRLQ